ncbi:MAG: hypothetical protein GY790_17700 [Bacteroidetes bacterium]|nr:hypothetical protein [Bacteroidota bacterium]
MNKLKLLVIIIAFSFLPSFAQTIQWLPVNPRKQIEGTWGFRNATTTDTHWQATVVNPVFANITISSLNIDLNKHRFLYIKMASTERTSLRILYTKDENGPFFSKSGFKTSTLKRGDGWNIYRVNLSDIPFREETIGSLQIYMPGYSKADIVRFAAIGLSSEEIEIEGEIRVTELTTDSGIEALNQTATWLNTGVDNNNTSQIEAHNRMAAWQDAMVATNDAQPNSLLMTYLKDQYNNSSHQYILAKIVPGIRSGNDTLWIDDSHEVIVEDFPGGVKAEFTMGGVKITTEITPLMIGRDDTTAWNGAAVYSFRTEPSAQVFLRCGSGNSEWQHMLDDQKWAWDNHVAFEDARVKVTDDFALLNNSAHPLTVAVKTAGKMTKIQTVNNAEYLLAGFESGEGQMLLTFDKEEQNAIELLDTDTRQALANVQDHYDELLKSKIGTPDDLLNSAFETAITTLEYTWARPYGWVEGIHHWVALWHMQHLPAALWLNQNERAVSCLKEHANKVIDGGAIPHLFPAGTKRRTFGGSNQFYFWQIREFLKYTNDIETLKQLSPVLDNVLDYTFREYDPDDNLLLAWGLQIGNQEDLVATPYDGAVPTIEGINMMNTRKMVAEALDDEQTIIKMNSRIVTAKERLRRELWINDLGRFAYYKDPTGIFRLEGPYQAYTYPVVFDIIDPLDGYTSIRHLKDRLTGPDGEIYCSNNFPDHLLEVWATWGMQAGAAQQPWGAWALAKMGMNNHTYRPLHAVAEWVNNPLQKGSWPEVANENRLGYFSPPAGVFIQSTIEALFGLQMDKPNNSLTVSPSFPDHWPNASLNLPEFSADFIRNGHVLKYTVTSKEELKRWIYWSLPPANIDYLRVNGKDLDFEIIPAVDGIILSAETGALKSTSIEIKISPVDYSINHILSIAQGEAFELEADGVYIEKIDDRCGVLSDFKIKENHTILSHISENLLDKYLNYGPLGQLNFSRRTLFIYCSTENNIHFWHPVDLTILPRYEVAGKIVNEQQNTQVNLHIRNNTNTALQTSAHLKVCQTLLPFDIDIAPRAELHSNLSLSKQFNEFVSPGENSATVMLGPEKSLDFKLIADESDDRLFRQNKTETVQVKLPEQSLVDGGYWKEIRDYYSHHFHKEDILEDFDSSGVELAIDQLPDIKFIIDKQRFVPVSAKTGKQAFTLDLESESYKKIYLLVIPFIRNHDVFSEIARIDVEINEAKKNPAIGKTVISRTLYSPGDLDWFVPLNWMYRLGTGDAPRADRHQLLPLLEENCADWEIAKPPLFPQRQFWTNTVVEVGGVTMNVIEIDLRKSRQVKSLTISTKGIDPAIGLVAVTAEK